MLFLIEVVHLLSVALAKLPASSRHNLDKSLQGTVPRDF
jgi:hypothetical protein